MSLAEEVIAALVASGRTVATAESLTGGRLCAALIDVPGASAVVRGGVVAYTVDMKCRLLGIDAGLIERAGVVSEDVARAMAEAVRASTGASVGVATTGVAGPEPHGGHPPGTVCIAVAADEGTDARTLRLAGGRGAIREATVQAALRAILTTLAEP